MSLTGWQAVAMVVVAAALGLAAALVPNQTATVGLLQLASVIVGGTFGLLQRQRDPSSRTRAADRSITAAAGVETARRP